MRDGLEGRVDLAPPSNWTPTFERLKQSSDVRIARLAVEVAQQFGDTEAARRNLTAVRTKTAAIGERQKALQTLAAQRRPELVPELSLAMDDAALRIDAIRAIAAFDDESLGKLLVTRFQTFNAAEKSEAVQTLASRGRYGRMLTDALASGAIAKRDVPPYAARQLRRVVGVRFADVWGPIDENAGEDRAYARYRGMLTDSAIGGANLSNGRATFQRTCGPCHKLYGEGGAIGPDLTGSNRANLEYLLSNVLNPSGEVQDAYKMVIVTTRDGRTHSGNVVSETDRQLTLRVVGRDPVAINTADIQSRETTATSMMPPGLFDALTDREIIDLVAYSPYRGAGERAVVLRLLSFLALAGVGVDRPRARAPRAPASASRSRTSHHRPASLRARCTADGTPTRTCSRRLAPVSRRLTTTPTDGSTSFWSTARCSKVFRGARNRRITSTGTAGTARSRM